MNTMIEKMRLHKLRLIYGVAVLLVILGMYHLQDLLGGSSAIHALKDVVLLRDTSATRHEFSIHRDSHNHNEQIPFILKDMQPTLAPRVARPIYNASARIGFQAQLGNKLEPAIQLATHERTVAIGSAITTRGQWEPQFEPERLPEILPFFKDLLLSFCRTASYGFEYHFYIAHDHEDPFFIRNASHHYFVQAFYGEISRACPKAINVTLHMVECSHAGHPAWAQNDAMMAAYMDDMAYYYRVNDDTVLETTGWTERLIEELLRYQPPNVGVAGPWFKEGNIAILTHDFVHRTHVDIFGFYYPRVFTDWFADDWITGIYYPERCHKVAGVRVKHTMELGNRYVVHYERAQRLGVEVEIGKHILKRWLQRLRNKDQVDKSWDLRSKLVISMSLYGSNMDYIYGALRYAQLVPILYPNWRVRVYVSYYVGKSDTVTPLDIIAKKLDNMGVEVIRLDEDTSRQVTPSLWRYLVADDESVDRFLVRAPNTRPGEREAASLKNWLKADAKRAPFHCIRDHPKHANQSLVPGLIGGVPSELRAIFGQSWRTLMRGQTTDAHFLNDVIWPKVKNRCYCHDSVSCKEWSGTEPFPILRAENEFVGQRYDSNDQEVDLDDAYLWPRKYIRPECVFVKNTGFDDEAVRAVIRHRPVFWSQDFHVTPVMDFKSLLTPIGVKILDYSLSYYCGSVGTCARGLRVINKENGMRPTPELMDQFYDAYKNDLTMKRVSAFICTLPVAMCELFVKFNKSMIVIATTRYEQARPEPEKWNKLNQLLLNVSKDSRSLVAANNLYDAKYIEFFTGIEPLVIPNYCGYLKDSYNPSRKQFLIAPIHNTELYDNFFTEFDEVIMQKRLDVTLFPLRQLYPQYLFSDLAAHPGIVYVPYQVSMSSLTEQYRMNIPLFFPTVELLTSWHIKYQVVKQRTWIGYLGRKESKSKIGGVQQYPDPNNDMDEDAIYFWLKFADFYQWPHVIYFDSVEDLVHKMVTVDLQEISNRMREHNEKVRQDIRTIWSRVLLKVTQGQPMKIPAS